MHGPSAPPQPLPPLLKWAGGKRWQLPYLRTLWEAHAGRRLVEPFCGGLAVSLGLLPARAFLNDANPHVINFYSHVKTGLRIEIEMKNGKTLYYRHRNRFNTLLRTGASGTKEAASLFYYLNRTGYNGLCRFNRQGEFNVPFGKHKQISYTRSFPDYQAVFAEWKFACSDIEDVELASDDFVYADPPYDVVFTHYSKGGFTWDDQVRTAELLARHPGPVVLVNQATERICRLYESVGFKTRLTDAPRRISCTGDRKPAREIIGIRNL